MAIEHDGASCRMPLAPVGLLIGLALVGGGGFLIASSWALPGAALVLVGLIFLLEQIGTRRIRVIHSKLLVEDYRLITNLLIGPRRDRVGWEEVTALEVTGNRLVARTAKAPFTIQFTGPANELTTLETMARKAWEKAKAGG
jgi:hypothetical protein